MAFGAFCTQCNKHNLPGTTECLSCGSTIAAASTPAAHAAASNEQTKVHMTIGLLAVLVVAVLLTKCVANFGGQDDPRREARQQALWQCQEAVRSAAKNPSGAKIPYAGVSEGGGLFHVDWRHGDGLRLQNGFGAMIDTTVACKVNMATMRVTYLMMDGKKLI